MTTRQETLKTIGTVVDKLIPPLRKGLETTLRMVSYQLGDQVRVSLVKREGTIALTAVLFLCVSFEASLQIDFLSIILKRIVEDTQVRVNIVPVSVADRSRW